MNLYEGIRYLLTEELLAPLFLTPVMFTLGEETHLNLGLGLRRPQLYDIYIYILIHQKEISGNKTRIIDGLQEKY